MQDREKMVRKRIRDNLRQHYGRYPMHLYDQLKRQQNADSIWATPEQTRATIARREKMLEDEKARRLESEEQEAQAIREFQAKHPETIETMREARKEQHEVGELVRRVYDEEVERLKTLPIVKRNPIREFIEAIQFRFYVIRHFGFHYKGKSVKFGPEDFAVRSPDGY